MGYLVGRTQGGNGVMPILSGKFREKSQKFHNGNTGPSMGPGCGRDAMCAWQDNPEM